MIFAAKYHGYGNDFLIVGADQLNPGDHSVFARAICEPHFGIGADGCVFLEIGSSGKFFMTLYNRDGSKAAMSGNGGRCVASYLHHRSLASGKCIEIDSVAGVRTFKLIDQEGLRWRYRSWMGEPDFHPSALPADTPPDVTEIRQYPLNVAGETICVEALWVGNPQCIVLGDELPDTERFHRLGAGLERHPFFPEGTNVGFAAVEDAANLHLRVWERGVGPTWSSGTGSCAAAVAAMRLGMADSQVTVTTETGSQQVRWKPGRQISLLGEAEFIADIQYPWDPQREQTSGGPTERCAPPSCQ